MKSPHVRRLKEATTDIVSMEPWFCATPYEKSKKLGTNRLTFTSKFIVYIWIYSVSPDSTSFSGNS